MKKILLFAGTTEGRLLTEYLIRRPILLHVCVATEYGRTLLPKAPNLSVSSQRMDSSQIAELIQSGHFDLVLDATHPYATDVTGHILAACAKTETPYQRILRDCQPSGEIARNAVTVHHTDEAVEYLKTVDGPVFLTTGSKTLSEFMVLSDASERLFVRILPNPDMLAACIQSGMPGSHIFCMQGPFDTEMNLATIAHIRRQWQKEHPENGDAPMSIVTKQSGRTGGLDEKLEAADAAGATAVIIGRPEEPTGLSLSDACRWLDTWCGYTCADTASDRIVSLIGTGMSHNQLTMEAVAALHACDMIIGARRMLDMVSDYGKPTFCSYNYPEIAAYMQLHTEYRHFAVLFSGDIGFYSGAARLRQCLEGMPFQIRSYSGIASPIHFLNRIGKTWEDVHLISCHGQTTPIIANVRSHPKTLALLGKPDDAANICQALTACGLHHTDIYIGAALQQPEELILQGKPADFISQNLPALSVIYIENPAAKDWPVTQGLSDDAFIRGKVPMTKSEVRSVVLSKLALTNTSVLYDIGAGTGSVAIEAARQMSGGHVYAIEKNPDGIALIRDNSRRLLVDNLSVIEGIAPECMSGLPPATHAFIGGTSGHLNDILQLLHKKNPRMHVVITAITLETLAEIVQLVKAASIPEPEIVQIQVSSSKKAGSYHLMQGQNPVYIISFQFL